jgi:serine/threonine protein phosphatase 1
MVDEINTDIKTLGDREGLTITLGDYIERGPDSFGVLDRLVHNPFPTGYVALKGNHEALFETFLKDPSVADVWPAQWWLGNPFTHMAFAPAT